MPNCCVENCNNYQSDTVYFKFPFHDAVLLQKWLTQLGKLNWQPNENDFICDKHFYIEDIINDPKEKNIVLKKDAIPITYSKHMKEFSPMKTKQSEILIKPHHTHSDVTVMPSIIKTNPLILTSTITEPIAAANSTFLSLSSTPQRFRKILPKINLDTNEIKNSSPEKNDISSNISSNSYIIIIPAFDNSKSLPKPNITPPNFPLPNNLKPILRLTVNRKYDIDSSLIKSKEHYNNFDKDNTMEEVIINHKTSNKVVVFTLNLLTDQISVSYRDISPSHGRNAKLSGTHMRLRENPRKKKMWEEPEELNNIYKRVKKDCSSLRSKLQLLRKKHQREKIEIKKLQEDLATIETNKETTLPMIKKQLDKTSKSAIDVEMVCKIDNGTINDNENIKTNDKKLIVNKLERLLMNDNEILSDDENHMKKITNIDNKSPFISKENGKKKYCDFTEFHEGTITIQSDVKINNL